MQTSRSVAVFSALLLMVAWPTGSHAVDNHGTETTRAVNGNRFTPDTFRFYSQEMRKDPDKIVDIEPSYDPKTGGVKGLDAIEAMKTEWFALADSKEKSAEDRNYYAALGKLNKDHLATRLFLAQLKTFHSVEKTIAERLRDYQPKLSKKEAADLSRAIFDEIAMKDEQPTLRQFAAKLKLEKKTLEEIKEKIIDVSHERPVGGLLPHSKDRQLAIYESDSDWIRDESRAVSSSLMQRFYSGLVP